MCLKTLASISYSLAYFWVSPNTSLAPESISGIVVGVGVRVGLGEGVAVGVGVGVEVGVGVGVGVRVGVGVNVGVGVGDWMSCMNDWAERTWPLELSLLFIATTLPIRMMTIRTVDPVNTLVMVTKLSKMKDS